MAAACRKDDLTTCAVCLNVYRQPKLLPCDHTFCASCIRDLADHHNGSEFPCPSCHTATSIPPGGVASLPANIYVQTRTCRQKLGTPDICKIHDEKLVFYCNNCEEGICASCKLTEHEQHETEDLATLVSKMRKVLQSEMRIVQRDLCQASERVMSLQEHRQTVHERKTVLEGIIRNQHAMIIAAANAKRDEELRALQSLHEKSKKDIECAIQQKQDNLVKLNGLIEEVDNAINSGKPVEIISVANEMKFGRGSKEALEAMIAEGDLPPGDTFASLMSD